MRRREIVLASAAATSALFAPRGEAQSCGGPCYPRTTAEINANVTVVDSSRIPGDVLRYGTNSNPGTTPMQAAFQAAADQSVRSEQDAAPVHVPGGSYLIASTISIATNKGFVMRGDGIGRTLITKQGDSDAFAITSGSSAFNQVMITDITVLSATAMTTGSAFKVVGGGAIPSLTMQNVAIQYVGVNSFRNGINAVTCGEMKLDRVFIYGSGSGTTTTGISITATGPATVVKIVACSIYNVQCGVSIRSSTFPGVEGVQFNSCDIVNVQYGVVFKNAYGPTYFPPQLTWLGGHINSSIRSFDLQTITQVTIIGLTSYNSGNYEHINLDTVGDVNIQGNFFVQVAGTANGITYSTQNSPLWCGIIASNIFRMSQTAGDSINLLAAGLTNLTIRGNQRVGGTRTVHVSSGTLDSTVFIKDNTLDDADVFDTSLTFASRLSLVGIRSDYVVLVSPAVPTTLLSLTARRSGDRVTLDCSSPKATIQHNGVNPDGFILAGGLNYSFPATGGRITLERRNGGYWVEVSRSG